MRSDVKQEPAEVAEAVPQIPLPRPGHGDAGTAVATRKPSSSWERLTALIQKEFLQIWRDRRTLGLIIFVPVTLMVIFGYAATFDVRDIPTELVGHDSPAIRTKLEAGNAFSVAAPVVASTDVARDDLKQGRWPNTGLRGTLSRVAVPAGSGDAGDVEAVLAGVHVDNVERESASLEDAFLGSIRRGGSAAS
jgi:hypothetical protein